jgi:opacity protein-like surface antigen
MKQLFLLIPFLLLTQCLFAQTGDWVVPRYDTYWMNVELGYGWTLAEKGTYNAMLIAPNNKKDMGDMGIQLGYYATPQLALSAKASVNVFRNYNLRSTLLFACAQYDFSRIPRLFAYAEGGILLSAETASTNILSSWMSDYETECTSGWAVGLGAGYRILPYKHRAVYVTAGYYFFHYALSIFPQNREGDSFRDNRSKHTVLLRVGYEFDIHHIFRY